MITLREKLIILLKGEGIACEELDLKPYRGTVWKINNKRCYIKQDEAVPWFDIPVSVLDQVDVLVFLASGNSADVPKPFLISTEDFRIAASQLDEMPVDGAYNVNILKEDWPYFDLRISLGDGSSSVPAPFAGDIGDPKMTLVFDTFELLENENDDPEIIKAFRIVEEKLNQ